MRQGSDRGGNDACPGVVALRGGELPPQEKLDREDRTAGGFERETLLL